MKNVKFKVLNSKGEAPVLNKQAMAMAKYNEKKANALGYEIQITTLTEISQVIAEEKFFEVPPSEFLPVVVGRGAWASNILHYKSFSIADDFITGVINQAHDDGRLATVKAGLEGVQQKVHSWGKDINYTLPELQEASRSGNWDLVTKLERARKKNWDLGIQKIAFLGNKDIGAEGLLTQSGIVPKTTVITKKLSAMTAAEYQAFAGQVLADYRTFVNSTTWPTHFVIPESDFLGLGVFLSADYPNQTKLEALEKLFKTMTNNPNFKIVPLAYANAVPNNSGTLVQRYALYEYNEESLNMSVPVAYTNTMSNSINGFQFHNVGYGQFTGVIALRQTMVYHDLAITP